MHPSGLVQLLADQPQLEPAGQVSRQGEQQRRQSRGGGGSWRAAGGVFPRGARSLLPLGRQVTGDAHPTLGR